MVFTFKREGFIHLQVNVIVEFCYTSAANMHLFTKGIHDLLFHTEKGYFSIILHCDSGMGSYEQDIRHCTLHIYPYLGPFGLAMNPTSASHKPNNA